MRERKIRHPRERTNGIVCNAQATEIRAGLPRPTRQAALVFPSAWFPPLPGLPWSPEFMAAYEDALAGQLVQVGSTRVKPGTIRALAISYYNSLGFRSLKPSSQAIYRRIIDRFCREHGDKRAATLQREHIVKLMAARAEKPASANALHKVLRALMQHAVEIGMRADDPTRNVKMLRVKTDGYHSWTDSEIEQFEAWHKIGSRARLAFALLLYTGQRRSDVVRMGRQPPMARSWSVSKRPDANSGFRFMRPWLRSSPNLPPATCPF